MRIAYLSIKNFRGISKANIYFDGHTVLIGDNNAGKSTVFEAIDLVLGPDRLSRVPVVDEHDFYNGIYYIPNGTSPHIEIELVLIDLNEDQLIKFTNHLEFWDLQLEMMLPAGSIDSTDSTSVRPALRLKFVGYYNPEDDDFEGNTLFCWPEREEGGQLTKFGKQDKRECGFLYLRALRTGSRALSMERGSLLDIILRIREIRPKMWESILVQLKSTDVAVEPELGITSILQGVQDALKEFVPSDWGAEPILKVSDLTREHLRKTLTIFLSTGSGTYHAPFQHQGTGTINTMVLALLTMIADAKKNVIFAMEEPEIAIPPYTQKRIVESIQRKSTQAIFTSHSPFVLEEFSPNQIILIQRNSIGEVVSRQVHFPASIKPKSYNQEFRTRFSEALLAKRVLLTEGLTEATSYSAAGRRLNEIAPAKYSSLEALGVAVFNVMSETAIEEFGKYFKSLGKTVFAVFDKQDDTSRNAILPSVDHAFESPYKGFEELLVQEISETVLRNFYNKLIEDDEWPQSLSALKVGENASIDQYKGAVKKYLIKSKGAHSAADLISLCSDFKEVPLTVRRAMRKIKKVLEPSLQETETPEP